LTPKSLSVSIALPNASNSTYVLDLEPLFSEIRVDECSHKVMGTKVEIRLRKKVDGVKWEALEGVVEESDKVFQVMGSVEQERPSYPSSSKKV
jgi:suppressor of G2 allele of SKP1